MALDGIVSLLASHQCPVDSRVQDTGGANPEMATLGTLPINPSSFPVAHRNRGANCGCQSRDNPSRKSRAIIPRRQ